MATTLLQSNNLKEELERLLADRPAASTLIVLDLDNTVFTPSDELQLASQQWFDGYRHYLMKVKGYDMQAAYDQAHKVVFDLHGSICMGEIEPGMTGYLNELGTTYSIIGLTARSYEIIGETNRQLNSIGLTNGTGTTSLNFKLHQFPDLDIEFGPLPADHEQDHYYQKLIQTLKTPDLVDRTLLNEYARFTKGIMYVGFNPKGKSLSALLSTVNLAHFTSIIFADDKRDHVHTVAAAVGQFNAQHHLRTEYIGIHYTALQDIAKSFTFDPLIHLPAKHR